MKKVLFIDRDWTLIFEPPITFQVNNLEEMIFLPMVISSLQRLVRAGFELVLVTNQDWLGTKSNPRENYEKINSKILQIFEWEWIEFSEIFECEHFPEDNCKCRKPKVWILKNYLEKNNIDLEKSYVIWDRNTDMEFAKNIWVKFERVIFWSEKYNWNNAIWRILSFICKKE